MYGQEQRTSNRRLNVASCRLATGDAVKAAFVHSLRMLVPSDVKAD